MKRKYSKSKEKKNYIHLIHPYEPIFNSESKILILGTIPSISSRENGFFYMHNKNRFWPIMQTIFNVKFKYENNEGKNALYLTIQKHLFKIINLNIFNRIIIRRNNIT